MQHLDEGTIHAWLDGELSPAEAEQIEAHTRECAECAQRVAEARGLIAASTRILNALDNVPSGVVPGATVPIAPARPRRWYDRTDLRAAAALLFVAGASLIAVKAGRNKSVSLQAMAKTESAPLTAPVVLDSGSPRIAEAPQSEPIREARRSAASPPAVASKVAPSTSKMFGSLRAMDEVSVPKSAEAPPAAQPAAAAPPLMRMNAAVAQRKAATANEPNALTGVVGGVGSQLSGLVVTSAASESALRVLRTDSTVTARHVVYEVSPGIQVTLADSLTDVTAEKDSKLRDKVIAAPAAVTATMSAMPTAKAPINTISWTDGNHHYTLTGPLSISELEALKPRIIRMRR